MGKIQGGKIVKNTDYEIMRMITCYLPQDKIQEFETQWEELKEKIEGQAYLEGYCYAIQLLEDSLKNKQVKR